MEKGKKGDVHIGNRIFCIMGKSGSGKDTLYRMILKKAPSRFRTVVPCTTRPIRAGEQDGREYRFFTDEEFHALEKAGKIIEFRCYQTCYGPWYYFTPDDGQLDLENGDVLLVGTLESFLSLRDYFGKDRVVPVYIEVEDGERLQRALDRERTEKVPKYRELCRRFLSDSEDFSEEKLAAAGITERFRNDDAEKTAEAVIKYITQGGKTDDRIRNRFM